MFWTTLLTIALILILGRMAVKIVLRVYAALAIIAIIQGLIGWVKNTWKVRITRR